MYNANQKTDWYSVENSQQINTSSLVSSLFTIRSFQLHSYGHYVHMINQEELLIQS